MLGTNESSQSRELGDSTPFILRADITNSSLWCGSPLGFCLPLLLFFSHGSPSGATYWLCYAMI